MALFRRAKPAPGPPPAMNAQRLVDDMRTWLGERAAETAAAVGRDLELLAAGIAAAVQLPVTLEGPDLQGLANVRAMDTTALDGVAFAGSTVTIGELIASIEAQQPADWSSLVEALRRRNARVGVDADAFVVLARRHTSDEGVRALASKVSTWFDDQAYERYVCSQVLSLLPEP